MTGKTGSLCIAILLSCTATTYAETFDDLTSLSLNELLDIQVDLSKRNTRAFDQPSATYIITQEDIRRSGATSIPEILRLVPGLHVG